MPRSKFKRKQYIIARGFQFRYAGVILALMMVISIVAAYTTYYTSLTLLGEKLANVYPQGRLVYLLKQVHFTLLVRLFMIMPVIFLFSIWLSHRIAGPIYRMKQFLSNVASGDLKSRLMLRKNDELKDMADAINKMVFKLDKTVTRIQDAVTTVDKDIEELQKTCGTDNPECKRAQELFGQVREKMNKIKSMWPESI